MRAVAQRVTSAEVVVDDEIRGAIDIGLLVYLGVGEADGPKEVAYMAAKLAGLRIFEDDEGRMSRSVQDVGGAILVVSQFTLYGDVRRGRRPSFTRAAPPELAETLYEDLVAAIRAMGISVGTGVFRADMQVRCAVDGPVTILLDSEKGF